jgi:hypothetical protein
MHSALLVKAVWQRSRSIQPTYEWEILAHQNQKFLQLKMKLKRITQMSNEKI